VRQLTGNWLWLYYNIIFIIVVVVHGDDTALVHALRVVQVQVQLACMGSSLTVPGGLGGSLFGQRTAMH
jgi:hypothetical protein